MAKTFVLAGLAEAQAKTAADTVFSFEKQLAEASLDNVALRDPAQTDHKMPFADLQKLTPRFDWGAYFDSAKVTRAELNVFEPSSSRRSTALGETPSPTGRRTSLAGHALGRAYLSSDFATESFALRPALPRRSQEMTPRWKRCVESPDDYSGGPGKKVL